MLRPLGKILKVTLSGKACHNMHSVTPDGKHTPTAHHMGEIRFNKGNRAHFELLTSGKLGATMVELQ